MLYHKLLDISSTIRYYVVTSIKKGCEMKKKINTIKNKIIGAYELLIALAQLAGGYVFVTDGRIELLVLGAILIFASIVSLTNKFVN